MARAVTERRAEACTNACIMATTLGAALVIDPDADPGTRAHPGVCATCESNGAADTDAPTAIAANAGHGPREGLARGFRMTKRDGDRTITAHCDVSSHPVGWRLHLWMDGRALTVETICTVSRPTDVVNRGMDSRVAENRLDRSREGALKPVASSYSRGTTRPGGRLGCAEAPAAHVSTVTHDRNWSCSAFVMSAGQQRVWSAHGLLGAPRTARGPNSSPGAHPWTAGGNRRGCQGGRTTAPGPSSRRAPPRRWSVRGLEDPSPRHDTRCPTQCERKSWALQTHLFTDFSPTLPEHWGRIDCRRLLGERP